MLTPTPPRAMIIAREGEEPNNEHHRNRYSRADYLPLLHPLAVPRLRRAVERLQVRQRGGVGMTAPIVRTGPGRYERSDGLVIENNAAGWYVYGPDEDSSFLAPATLAEAKRIAAEFFPVES